MKLPRFVAYLGLAAVITVAALAVDRYLSIGAGSSTTSKTTSSGKSLIGGAFTLVNQDGTTVTEKDFRGKYMLIYFGYTYCPDACPTALSVMGEALDQLGDKAGSITPVLITIDPERDTPEILKAYVPHFHPRLVGLTGSKEQAAATAKTFRVYFSKVVEKDAPKDTQKDATADDYLMDHSSIIYLMGPDGTFISHFSHGTKPEDMAAKLAEVLKSGS